MSTAPGAALPNPAAALAALRRAVPNDAAGATRAGLLAMQVDREEEAVPLLRQAAERHPREALLWQVFGLAARNTGDLATAVEALTRARALSPRDGRIAHGAARARLEAGLPAVDDFLAARRLIPVDGPLLQGLAAARFANGDVAGAIAEIEAVVQAQPLWLDGHATLARLRRMAGDADDLRSYRTAAARMPDNPAVWSAWLSTLALAERFGDLPGVVAEARAAIGAHPALDHFAAIAADEGGDHQAAGAYFDSLADSADPAGLAWRVRSLIHRGRIEEAGALALRGAAVRGEGRALWPYVALAWRMIGDARWAWLEGDPAFVQVHDISDALGDREVLAARLRTLHIARDQPLDQSVRKGTQTDGPLFARIEPEIVRLRNAIRGAVSRYIDTLPPQDTSHPLLACPRTPIRFAGSWSVRLNDGGFHADHVHSHGWISSALYVSLPERLGGERREGWLTLGACERLVPSLPPFREIAPRPGTLVLFPSTMWHGTRPFDAGERLTVAFDVAQPRSL
ncbi:2OG-Fe(II) oxygenase family protein [Sphingomonas jeddahensis]|uniref:Uncharacterized protein n=1 Tax=Sphingomonas jeddahensis TaxID=1915074 RepID=A0A1V2EUT1_9SPHN|nr:putative 2OG-Fe(II) oxygenase [Sphingomonas jeddahensis]ONF96432.1 hypothetical protein SPHI_12170 [Sphingomonas jeddahensis]